MDWKTLESRVREVASYLWDAPARSATVNGVNVDCVIEHSSDYWVLVEISKESTLDKLRTDLGKFATVRPYLFSKSIYPKCIFVCQSAPPPSLVTSGKGSNVDVVSFAQFEAMFFDYPRYHFVRSDRPFGSAVDPFSGIKDSSQYVPVQYKGLTDNRLYSIGEIANLVANDNRVVLLGNYGTGKSRCIQELFHLMRPRAEARHIYPLSIDLRHNWGVRRGSEIIRRHFDDLGLSKDADNLIKVLAKGRVPLLIDGFDEIGSQAWSDDPTLIKNIRMQSLSGVRDLIGTTTAGVIVTGREHYFDSHTEMFACLGLNPEKTVLIECHEEFSDEEVAEYLKALSISLTIPDWIPKRPLVCQILRARDNLTWPFFGFSGLDGVVPVAVEGVPFEMD